MAVSTNEKKSQIRSKRVIGISVAPNISGTIDAGNFKFGTDMDGSQH